MVYVRMGNVFVSRWSTWRNQFPWGQAAPTM